MSGDTSPIKRAEAFTGPQGAPVSAPSKEEVRQKYLLELDAMQPQQSTGGGHGLGFALLATVFLPITVLIGFGMLLKAGYDWAETSLKVRDIKNLDKADQSKAALNVPTKQQIIQEARLTAVLKKREGIEEERRKELRFLTEFRDGLQVCRSFKDYDTITPEMKAFFEKYREKIAPYASDADLITNNKMEGKVGLTLIHALQEAANGINKEIAIQGGLVTEATSDAMNARAKLDLHNKEIYTQKKA